MDNNHYNSFKHFVPEKKDDDTVKKEDEKNVEDDCGDNSTYESYKDKVTLDVLLEILDGYTFLRDCIIFITSNHPEKLDPALIRSGRIDQKIEFEMADQYQFNNIFTHFTRKMLKILIPILFSRQINILHHI